MVLYTTGTKNIQLKVSVKGANSRVVWTSSNKSVATVDTKGKVTAKKAGTVTISAKANGVTAKCKVTVKVASGKSTTYQYAYNINDFGMWKGNNFREITITPLTSKTVKISYHYLDGSAADESYIAHKTGANQYEYTPKANQQLYKGYKDKFSLYPEKRLLIFHGFEAGNSYYFAKLNAEQKSILSDMIRELPKGSWWSGGFKYSIGIFDNYVLVSDTYGKLVGGYGINYVKKTSYGYFINIAGYYNYRWYRSKNYQLQCYSSESGTKGYNAAASFTMFGC